MRCQLCTDGLDHCHEVSIEHVDGITECGGDRYCVLAHHLHEWRVSCAEIDPPCACVGADEVGDRPLPVAA